MVFGCVGCCVFPHGRKSLLALLIAIGAYTFLSVSMWSCVFLEIDGYLSDVPPYVWPGSVNHFSSHVGLFSYMEFNEGFDDTKTACTFYSREQLDGYESLDTAFKAARACALVSNILLVVGTVALLISSCAFFDPVLLKVWGTLLILGSICEALIFIVYASDMTRAPHNASFWWGSVMAILGSLFAMIAGIIALKLPPWSEDQRSYQSSQSHAQSPNRRSKPRRNTGTTSSPVLEQARPQKIRMPAGSKTTTETILPDGRHQYTTTEWKKDGTATVTETIVE